MKGFVLAKILKMKTSCIFLYTVIVCCTGSEIASAKYHSLKEQLFAEVFGEAAQLNPEIIAKVKLLKHGERLYLDRDGDGRNDEVYYIDTSFRHTQDVQPLLVRVIDEDNDFEKENGPDLDSDLYVADWRADGRVDAIIDYTDTDGDQDVDEMGIYYYCPRYGFLDYKPALLVWWGRDIGDDNLLWYDANLTYSQNICQYLCHFSGDEVFMHFGLLWGGKQWLSIFENPFAFYDPDADTCSEEVVRLSGSDNLVEALRYSIDIDDDAYGQRTHDYDFSITAIGAGRYLPRGVAGPEVRYPDNLTIGMKLRGIPTQPRLPWEQARAFAKNAPWTRMLLTWDELNANTDFQVERDPHERWEGVINNVSEIFPQVGGPPCSKLNKRNEASLHPCFPLRLYYDSTDHRLHLKGANEGWLDIDFDLDGKIDAKYNYLDENQDGFFDRRQIDVDADGTYDFDWKMKPQDVREFDLDFASMSTFYRPKLIKVLEDSQEFIDAAKIALASKTNLLLASAVEEYFLNQLPSWVPQTKLGERVRETPAGARLYVELLRDRLLLEMQNIFGVNPVWPKIVSLYANGDYSAAAHRITESLCPTNQVCNSNKFGNYMYRIPLKFNNFNGPQRDSWPVSIPVKDIKSVANDFNPNNCAIVAPQRWIDWRQIPHQLDNIDSDIGEELSFLIDVRADENSTYYLYYSPSGTSKTEFPPKTATAVDWIPPNIGWESERTAYRTYCGQFDFFGKKEDQLIYPTIGHESYHSETKWGIDALHVGETTGLGGLTLYVNKKKYPVLNPAGKGNVNFSKRMLVSGPIRAAVELTASNIIPEKPDLSLRMLCIIYAQHQESEIRVSTSGDCAHALLGIGLSKLQREDIFINKSMGCLGAWGYQEAAIGEIGLGLIVPHDRYKDVAELAKQRNLRCDFSDGHLCYWIIGDWRRGRQYPIAPNIENWKRELNELSRQLHNPPGLTVGSRENINATSVPAEKLKVQKPDQITQEAEKVFNELAAKQPDTTWIKNASGGSLGWSESYRLMAFVGMYEATGNTKYINEAIQRMNAVLEARDDRHQRVDEYRNKIMPAWGSDIYTKGKWYCWGVHANMVCYPIARLAYLIKRDPNLDRKYGVIADQYIQAVEQTVHAYEHIWCDGPGDKEGHCRNVYTKSNYLPYNHNNAFGRTLVTLWLITGELEYRQKAEKLAQFFKNQIKLIDNRYCWPYAPFKNDAEDISHAAINVGFVFACYRARIGFTKTDLQRISHTLLYCSRGSQGYTKTVDGQGGDFEYSAQMGRWGLLAFVDPKVRQNLYDYFKLHWKDDSVASMISAAYLAATQNEMLFDKPLSTD